MTVAPEYNGEPGKSSLKRASDLSLEKPAIDIVLAGHVWAPNQRPVQVMDVSLTVGPIQKIARVFGDRVWRYTGVGFEPTAPAPFTMMPVLWERSYGGRDRIAQGETQDARNPVGTGFRVPEGEPVEGVRLPNFESPNEPIASWNQHPRPIGFGAIDAYWEPRRSYAGTYDERWQQSRAPYLPVDFDSRFLQVAPLDMIAATLDGGQWVDLRGFTPSGLLQFQIPTMRPRIVYRVDDAEVEKPAVLDTVILEPDNAQFQLVWRAALRCDKKTLRVSVVEASMPDAS